MKNQSLEVMELTYSPSEIALAAKLDKETVLKAIHSGDIAPAYKPFSNVIRVPASAVNEWLRRSTITPRSKH